MFFSFFSFLLFYLPPPPLVLYYLDGEGRTFDVVIGEFQVDDVVAGLRGFVGDVKSAVFFVGALNFGFAGSFDRKGQTTETCK